MIIDVTCGGINVKSLFRLKMITVSIDVRLCKNHCCLTEPVDSTEENQPITSASHNALLLDNWPSIG